MSCNCGGGGHHHPIPPHGPGHDCNLINHAFDPNPPAFYGTWKHLHGHDATSRVSVSQPGVQSGLYKKCGPLNCQCNCAKMYTLTGIKTVAKIVLEVRLSYTIADMNKVITISPGDIYTFEYLEDGELKTCTGKVANIYKVNELEGNTNLYKIRVDCSTDYSHNVVVFKTDQLRGVEKFYQYAAEDNAVTNGVHEGGTTIAQTIRDAIVIGAELDSNKNIYKGTIIAGTLDWGQTIDGVCIGTNSSGHDIMMSPVTSTGGEIAGGTILNGIVRTGDIDGEVDPDTGIVTNATIKGIIANAVIANSKVSGARVDNGNGTVIEPVIEDSIVYNAVVTGENMVTTGGITVGNMTTGGITKGGTARGGIAYGIINGKQYVIEDGTTTTININTSNEKLTTTGGVLIGGTAVGGTKIGNAIYGATITGGTVNSGLTTGGNTEIEVSVKKTLNGSTAKLLPAAYSSERTGSYGTGGIGDKLANIITMNPNYDNVQAQIHKENRWSMNSKDLILATDRDTRTELYTNIGTATIQEVQDLGRVVDP